MVKIYFGTAPLVITDDSTGVNIDENKNYNQLLNPSEKDVLSLLKKLKTDPENAFIQTENLELLLKKIKQEFTVIQAGGGLAYTPDEQVLLIFRKGKWDLPKGKLDAGETLETCAVREVEEETGLKNIKLGEKLDLTFHTYKERGKDILKESHWYLMTTPEAMQLVPQTEEDIQECRWVPKKELHHYITDAHPSVADILNNWLKNYF